MNKNIFTKNTACSVSFLYAYFFLSERRSKYTALKFAVNDKINIIISKLLPEKSGDCKVLLELTYMIATIAKSARTVPSNPPAIHEIICAKNFSDLLLLCLFIGDIRYRDYKLSQIPWRLQNA